MWAPGGGPLAQVGRDFCRSKSLGWTPSTQQGLSFYFRIRSNVAFSMQPSMVFLPAS